MVFAHLTATEGPALWAVFVLGMVAGGAVAHLVPLLVRRLKAVRSRGR